MSALHTYEQEKWHEQHPVAIHKGAIVSVDGIEVSTQREQALSWIILRLHAQGLILKNEIKKMKEERKKKVDFIHGMCESIRVMVDNVDKVDNNNNDAPIV
jgi:hypothetical protein